MNQPFRVFRARGQLIKLNQSCEVMANAGRRRWPLFVRFKWCQVEMEINIFSKHGHMSGVIIRDFRAAHPSAEIRVRGNLRRFFSAERLAGTHLHTYLRCDPGHGLEYVLDMRTGESVERGHTGGGSGIRGEKKALLPGKIVGTRGTS